MSVQTVTVTAPEQQPAETTTQQSQTPAQSQTGSFAGFASVEELTAAYEVLKSGVSKVPDAQKPGAEIKEPAVEQPSAEVDRFQKFSTEFHEKGALSPESLAELAQMGISSDMVNAYTTGLQAAQERTLNQVYALAGGEQQYQNLITWAGSALTPDERSKFNTIIKGGDAALIGLAVDGLNARYQRTVQSPTAHLLKGSVAQATDDRFASFDEAVEAMKDPRYTTNEAYRNTIEKKLLRSRV